MVRVCRPVLQILTLFQTKTWPLESIPVLRPGLAIQEFLAAWYITYRYIPKGGNLGEIGLKLGECLDLENVFPFVCGLSDVGALMALSHLKSVKISDPSLDLSNAIPDVESETDVPLSSLHSKRFRLVSEQRNTEEGDFRF